MRMNDKMVLKAAKFDSVLVKDTSRYILQFLRTQINEFYNIGLKDRQIDRLMV